MVSGEIKVVDLENEVSLASGRLEQYEEEGLIDSEGIK